jgi:chemotaxis signal transduction protein
MSEMENSWLAFQLAKRNFAMRTIDIIEMIPLGKINKIVDAPPYIRGVLNLRDKIIPLMDLRKKFGMPSLAEECEKLCESLMQRKQDHINWLNELNNSVIENREFKLTTDPHKCAFGKWYDSYKSENVYIKILLDKFDDPHKRIHSIANVVGELITKGKNDEAILTIESVKQTTLSKMISLFDQTITAIRENLKEIVIVASLNNTPFGFSVDIVNDVFEIANENIDPPPALQDCNSTQYCRGIAKMGDKIGVLLDLELLLTDRALKRDLNCVVSPA